MNFPAAATPVNIIFLFYQAHLSVVYGNYKLS